MKALPRSMTTETYADATDDATTEVAEESISGTESSSSKESDSHNANVKVEHHHRSKKSKPEGKSKAFKPPQRTPPTAKRWNFGPNDSKPTIGIVGLGDIGSMFARTFCNAGYTVMGCDLPARFEELRAKFQDCRNMIVLNDAIPVARSADIQIYAVDTAAIEDVARQSGPATKVGSCVLGLCNVKGPEIAAFEKWLPKDVSIVPVHSMHGHNVNSKGQTMVMIPQRCTAAVAANIRKIFEDTFGYVVQEMSAEDHDIITADTMVLTHVGLLAMSNAWCKMGSKPWEKTARTGGLVHIKVLTSLRVYALKAHAYSGVAMLNPRSRVQVQTYAESVSELYKLMVSEDEKRFTARIMEAKEALFSHRTHEDLLLPPSLLEEFCLSDRDSDSSTTSVVTRSSHLDLLAAVDAWHRSGINPFANLVCETPVFRLRLGIAEYLFCRPEMLQESIEAALYDKNNRILDFEFVLSVKEWATIIAHGDVDAYAAHFADCKDFFKSQVEKASTKSARLIAWLSTERQSHPQHVHIEK
mmetsp:Transcript_22554/g.49877  ORF Transcript_22554/g.49877 Transcript_22554/m.49877 type:complete len:528 (-) Transcript_22554:162-1745(-)